MSQNTNDSGSRNPGGDAGMKTVIDMERLQALTNKYREEMVNKVSATFPMRGLKEFLRVQCNEFASNLLEAILTVLENVSEKKEEKVGEKKGENKQMHQEPKKQLKHTVRKTIGNIKKEEPPHEGLEHGEETRRIETVALVSQKMTEEEVYNPFIYASEEEEMIHLRKQVEDLKRIIDRVKPLVETDLRYKVIVFIGNRGETTAEELGDALGLTAGKLSRVLKELRKLEMVDVNKNGVIVLKPRKSEEELQEKL